MDEPESEDSIDDLLTALEEKKDPNIRIIRGPSSDKEKVNEVEPSFENLIPLGNNTLLEIGENVNISDLFDTDNVEFIYDEPNEEILSRNETKFEDGNKLLNETLETKENQNEDYVHEGHYEEILRGNGTGTQIEEANNLWNETLETEYRREDDGKIKNNYGAETVECFHKEQTAEIINDDGSGSRMEEDQNKSLNETVETEENKTDDEQMMNNKGEGKIKRTRNKKADPSLWEKNQTKLKRMTGQPFIGFHRKKIGDNIKVTRTTFEREGRRLGLRCNSEMCKKSKKRFCNEFSDDDRQNIFNDFWILTWKEKEVYVKCNTSLSKPKRRSGLVPSRRSGTVQYNLRLNGVLKQVCKKMFLHTLGLNEWMVLNWINKHNIEEKPEEDVDSPELDITATTSGTTLDTEILKESSIPKIAKKRENLIEWFDSIPKLPSHYARRDSKKLYVEPMWASKSEMYRAYKEKMIGENKSWGSIALFEKVFDELNLSLFTPRKDQCDTCCSYKVGNVSDEIYNQHIKEKDRARKEKEQDKELAKENKIYCLTCDLQAVKITPMTKASAMYYKTKLASHNFTVYNIGNHDCTNYWFNESECELNAPTFASCLINYIEEKFLSPKLPIVIYSDGCTYQNRNQVMSNALLHFAINNDIQIEQKYLVKGHTQMECDSVHACIERKLKNKDIYIPYDLVKYTQDARAEPMPYNVKYLHHDFFLDYSKINYYDSIRPGRTVGDPVVTDIHVLLYKSDGKIYFKINFDDEFKELPRRPTPVEKGFKPPRLYQQRLPIVDKKWNHLQELKAVIPADFHGFYDNLPHGKIKTRPTKETEIEDMIKDKQQDRKESKSMKRKDSQNCKHLSKKQKIDVQLSFDENIENENKKKFKREEKLRK